MWQYVISISHLKVYSSSINYLHSVSASFSKSNVQVVQNNTDWISHNSIPFTLFYILLISDKDVKGLVCLRDAHEQNPHMWNESWVKKMLTGH